MGIDTAFTHFPTLTTERLQLREIQPSDIEALFATFSDEEVMRYYGKLPHQSLAETQTWFQQLQERYTRREAIRWGIALKGEESIIGTCSFHHFGPDYHYTETGYDLNRTYWGRGIMTEAMSAVLSYGFHELAFHRIEAIIDIANEGSKNLLLKLGFAYEGMLRQRFYFNGQFEDEHYFSLLKDEWRGSF
ncbi:N-acetyltransferase [Ktedonobacter sp. SOSP1-52]|uniref:GNAT family N-acetyltransferase n=1 Tax=Ktedonobacter sp. SOSP1-52 TaxID=2778366 RepID=UPI00191599D8|nr:GNAT family protein [Ktedonobacter sp. SOSP1-52]GHO64973.1 N-acetyltransferase [Ktedonobacter sp. SOSP1-52]